MKHLIVILFVVLSINSIKAQSLADITGEQTSLYNAICIYNDITPGSIGMSEFRELAVEYTNEISLNYTLFTKNGGNNLEILHYVPANNELNMKSSDNNFFSSTPSTGCICDNIAYVSAKHAKSIDTVVINTVDTVVMTVAPLSTTPLSTTPLNTIDVVKKAVESANDIVSTPVINTNPNNYTCNCENMTTSKELNEYYYSQLKARKDAPRGLEKDKLGQCVYEIRMYKKTIEAQEEAARRLTRSSAKQSTKKKKSGTKSVSNKIRKPRGAKHTKGKGSGFLTLIFPNINC